MKTDLAGLAAWFESPLGRALLDQEREAVGETLECVFGVQCLQVGAWGPPGLFLDLARTQRRALLSARGEAVGSIRSHPSSLPIQSDSIDLLLLPHTLEFEEDPHEVLREAGRVLRAEGCLVVVGFEPLGSWALRSRVTAGGFPPGMARLLSERRLADWLKLLAFDLEPASRFLFSLPFARAQAGRMRRWADGAGRMLWPRLSGAYVLAARKRVYSVTPIRLQFRTRPAVLGGLAEPTTRVGT
jgi:SAM-dependent methyltransferase